MSRRIRSIEQLGEALDKDISWRKKEILDMRLISKKAENVSCLPRASFVLVCAHFEGFIRYASNAYISYLTSLGLKCEQLRIEYSSLIVRNKKHSLFNIRSDKKVKVNVVSELLECFNIISSQPFILTLDDDDMPIINDDNPSISTEGNPTPEVLREISSLIGLDYDSLFGSREQFISRDLLKPRHMIAHGQNYPVDIDEVIVISDYILKILDTFKDQVVSLANNDFHLRQ